MLEERALPVRQVVMLALYNRRPGRFGVAGVDYTFIFAVGLTALEILDPSAVCNFGDGRSFRGVRIQHLKECYLKTFGLDLLKEHDARVVIPADFSSIVSQVLCIPIPPSCDQGVIYRIFVLGRFFPHISISNHAKHDNGRTPNICKTRVVFVCVCLC